MNSRRETTEQECGDKLREGTRQLATLHRGPVCSPDARPGSHASALVSFVISPEPWEIERRLLHSTSLSLNLRDNEHHRFHATLIQIRGNARQRARVEWLDSTAGCQRTAR